MAQFLHSTGFALHLNLVLTSYLSLLLPFQRLSSVYRTPNCRPLQRREGATLSGRLCAGKVNAAAGSLADKSSKVKAAVGV